MKILSRDFTVKEKALLLFLVLVVVALVYYQFVDVPVREGLLKAEDQKQALEIELEAVNVRIQKLAKMQSEIDQLSENGTLISMPSYNNSKNVYKLLNDVLGDMGYAIAFSNVTRSGDQVRRNISLQFVAPDYATVRKVLSDLTCGEYRCLVNDVQCSSKTGKLTDAYVSVSASLTFFETMVGGEPDAGLPEDKVEEG